MNVFVTGATGSIGAAIVRELQTAGHQVVEWRAQMLAPSLLSPLAPRCIEVVLKTWKPAQRERPLRTESSTQPSFTSSRTR
jgi:hypothetical protein